MDYCKFILQFQDSEAECENSQIKTVPNRADLFMIVVTREGIKKWLQNKIFLHKI